MDVAIDFKKQGVAQLMLKRRVLLLDIIGVKKQEVIIIL